MMGIKRYKIIKACIFLGMVMMIIALYGAFIYAPKERIMGDVQRIFYFHLPIAGIVFLAYSVVFISSILYLVKKNIYWDILASSAVEIGIVFTTLVLITGVVWARPVWNTWWTWDPRLTTTLILWFIYVVYIMMRSAIEDEGRRARFCAILGIIGFIDVPIVRLSVKWWRSIHPYVIKSSSDVGLEPAMIKALVLSMVAFLILSGVIFVLRVNLSLAEREIEIFKADRLKEDEL